MKSTRVLAGLVLLAIAGCGGSGDDGGTGPVNEAPVLTFMTTAIAVPKGTQSNLTIEASDADSDPLTITWEITRGTLTSQNGLNTVMRWSVPATAGEDTVTIRANDGTATTSITAVIKAGTLVTTSTVGSLIKASSPYIIRPGAADPKITILGGSTIEPGTELLIDTANAYLLVLDDFQAHGTVDEPIVMRPNNRTFKCADDRGWWAGIRGDTDDAAPSNGSIDFEHVEIWDANWGVRLLTNSNATLRDCKILCSGTAGALMEGNGFLRLIDTRVSDGLEDGISIGGPNVSSLPDSVRIDGCAVVFNGSAGIRMDLKDADKVAPIVVSRNQIEFNASHGISLANSVFPDIHLNAFKGNGDQTVSNLFLQGGYPGTADADTLDATCNFWGTVNATAVDASIRDKLDTSAVGTRVDSCPRLNSSPITGSPTCTGTCPQ
jgi:hypothetical protein